MEKKLGKRTKRTKNWEKGRKGRKNQVKGQIKKHHQSRFLEALLVRKADGELKKCKKIKCDFKKDIGLILSLVWLENVPGFNRAEEDGNIESADKNKSPPKKWSRFARARRPALLGSRHWIK